MKTLKLNYTGRKARIGKVCFDEKGHMVVFFNYCPDCNAKVVCSRAEAEQFSALWQAEKGTLLNRLMFHLMRRRMSIVEPVFAKNPKAREDLLQELAQALQNS